jgi:lipoate-protein ligase A
LGDRITKPIWRLIDTDLNHPYFVTAADEAIAIAMARENHNIGPTLHFYRRNPPGISVGYFRKTRDDVDVELCKKLGIVIVRRTSAGGSIYTDKDQLIFSLISKKPLGKNVEDIFRNVGESIIGTLNDFEIIATFKPPNDVQINGKKISGSAQVKKRNIYLIHSTLIISIDQALLERVLKNHTADNVSSIEHETGKTIAVSSLKEKIKDKIAEKFNIQFKPGTFSDIEGRLIDQLINDKYSTNQWNFKR